MDRWVAIFYIIATATEFNTRINGKVGQLGKESAEEQGQAGKVWTNVHV